MTEHRDDITTARLPDCPTDGLICRLHFAEVVQLPSSFELQLNNFEHRRREFLVHRLLNRFS